MLKNNVHNSQQETCNVVFRFYITSDCQHQPHTCFMTVVGACVGSIKEGLKDFIYLEECGHYTRSNLQLRHNLQSFFQGQSSITMSTTSPPNMRMQSTNIVDEDHWKKYCVTAGKSISILRWCVIFFRITFEADYTSICQAQDFARHPPFGMTCGRHAVASYKNSFLCLYFFYIVNTIGKSLNLYMYDSNDHCYTSYLKFWMIF